MCKSGRPCKPDAWTMHLLAGECAEGFLILKRRLSATHGNGLCLSAVQHATLQLVKPLRLARMMPLALLVARAQLQPGGCGEAACWQVQEPSVQKSLDLLKPNKLSLALNRLPLAWFTSWPAARR